ncbi:unnamed protein product [Cochlearia groenlandica]
MLTSAATLSSGLISLSPAIFPAKSRRQFSDFRSRLPSLPVVSASLRHIEDTETTTTTTIRSLFSNTREVLLHNITLADIEPETAKIAISIIGPCLSTFGFLFIVRIVMSWYPKLPVDKFPYVLAYAPTEPILVLTRKVVPPLAGVDVSPVVWFGLVSFLSEILVGPQGLLVLVSQHTS